MIEALGRIFKGVLGGSATAAPVLSPVEHRYDPELPRLHAQAISSPELMHLLKNLTVQPPELRLSEAELAVYDDVRRDGLGQTQRSSAEIAFEVQGIVANVFLEGEVDLLLENLNGYDRPGTRYFISKDPYQGVHSIVSVEGREYGIESEGCFLNFHLVDNRGNHRGDVYPIKEFALQSKSWNFVMTVVRLDPQPAC